jgi:choice-of-anchor C domain-containing protein
MRSTLVALVGAWLAIVPASGQPGDVQLMPRDVVETGGKHAIVIGIGDYDIDTLRLSAAARDAERVAEFLRRKDRTGGYDVRLLTEKAATRRAIGLALEDVRARSGPNDTVLFFFSGHGIRDESGEGHLCPVDVDPRDIDDTGYALAKVKAKLQQARARQKVILLDCCHSGSLGDSIFAKGGGASWVTAQQMQKLAEGTGIVILSSSQASQRSWEDTGPGGTGLGYFTKYLLRGLEGEADGAWAEGKGNSDGLVSITELASYIYYRANNEVLERHGSPQQAELAMNISGNLFLSLIPSGEAPPSPPPTTTPTIPTPSSPPMPTMPTMPPKPPKPPKPRDNLLVNGSFESIRKKTDPGQAFPIDAGSNILPGWTVTGVGIDYVIAPYWAPSHGRVSLDLSGTNHVTNNYAGGVSQAFATEPGAVYQVQFDMAGNQYQGGSRQLEVEVGDQEHTYTFNISSQDPKRMGWVRKRFLFTASETTTTISFRSMTTWFAGPTLDNVVVRPQ